MRLVKRFLTELISVLWWSVQQIDCFTPVSILRPEPVLKMSWLCYFCFWKYQIFGIYRTWWAVLKNTKLGEFRGKLQIWTPISQEGLGCNFGVGDAESVLLSLALFLGFEMS